MNDKSIKLGFGITVIWLAVIGLFCFYGNLESPKSLNELGDALAGIFAPVAFLWLVLGYRQQGKQLEQNTTALKQQERALQLQIDEMKESVQQQKKQFEIQSKQLESVRSGAEPCICFEGGRGGFALEEKSVFIIVCGIKNIGLGSAKNIQLYSNNSFETIFFKNKTNTNNNTNMLVPNKSITISFELHRDNLIIYNEEMVRLTFEIRYEDIFKNIFSKTIVGNAVRSDDSNYGLDIFFN